MAHDDNQTKRFEHDASDTQNGICITGKIKWFDLQKGFGFIVSDSFEEDILLHANVLRKFGQNSIAKDSAIRVIAQETLRGYQAVDVLRVEPPLPLDGFSCGLSEYVDHSLPLQPARVRWFDKSKGYGFANVFGSSEDVFILAEVLHRSGLSDLQPGEAVSLRSVVGLRGLMANQVTSWEAPLRAEAED
ncbi:MAG: cold shock domain-containing protein [Pseudomonadota bacterium]